MSARCAIDPDRDSTKIAIDHRAGLPIDTETGRLHSDRETARLNLRLDGLGQTCCRPHETTGRWPVGDEVAARQLASIDRLAVGNREIKIDCNSFARHV